MDYSKVPFSSVSAQLRSREGPDSLGGYNALAYNTRGGSNAAGVVPPMPVTEMPMGNLYDWQRGDMRSKTRGYRGANDIGSTGVGAYQFESQTLRDTAEKVFGSDWRNTKFTPENQERLAEYLYDSVKSNPNRLASTWAMFGQNNEGSDMQTLPMTRAAYGNVPADVLLYGREGNLKVQDPASISQSAVEATDNINRMQQFKRQMLPLALGSMMSEDKGSQLFGANTFREAMEGVEPFKMQNGFLTDEGQYITDQDQSGLLKQTLSQMNRDRTAELQQANANSGAERSLADNYRRDAKDAITAVQAYKKLQGNDVSAMNDMALVFNFMKMLDTPSVVKETEYANVARARGIPDTVAQLLPKAALGEILSPTQRADILGVARKYASDAADVIEGEYNYHKQQAEKKGYDVSNIVPEMHMNWVKNIKKDAEEYERNKVSASKKATGQIGTTGTSQTEGRKVKSEVRTDKVTGRDYIIGPDGEPDWVN